MLTDQQITIIQENQSVGIQQKSLSDNQLKLIYQYNWFNIWVPKQLNGLELTFPSGLELIEELAYWDAGLAWTITLCSGANMFAGFIEPSLATQIWQDPKVCLGGSGRVGGMAIKDANDFIISGFWSYATGAPHLTHFTLNAKIVQNGQELLDENGEPVYYSFFVPREHVLFHYDWDTFGLECTASHSFSLENVRIPQENAFILAPHAKKNESPLFNIPFLPFAELTLLMNYIGMFKRFLDLSEKYYFEKSKDPNWVSTYSKLRFRTLDQMRTSFEIHVEQIKKLADLVWDNAEKNKITEPEILDSISSLSKDLVKNIKLNAIDLLPNLGIRAAQRENELNIVFRNLFTASQHRLLNI
ncbi:acyl-CoA dehydrogenase family protein [Sphingobacterium endophyticum]|uniref:acyl-CoA dehydrogenase n=1 Tax=Sphingobacterium endophyticum TaxID=2546448 RepID=UPI0012E259DB|nr:acyl-CoA dehydrogenase [Sphingobacterium endophyticum]